MKRRDVVTGLSACSLLAVAGCQTNDMIATQSDWNAAKADDSQSIVFGRVRWIENGKERQMEQNLFGWYIEPRLKRMEDGRTLRGKVDPGGHFSWSLPPGTYAIDKIDYRDPVTGNYLIVPKVVFRVPEGGQVYYVGTLRADAVSRRDLLGTLAADVKFSIVNQQSRERGYIRAQIGVEPSKVRTSLMVQDDRIPDSFDTTAEAQLLLILLGAASL